MNMNLVEISKKEYEKYCEEKNVDWLQSVEFANFRELRGSQNFFLALKKQNKILIAGLVSGKNKRFDLVMIEQKNQPNEVFLEFLTKSEEFCKKHSALSFRIIPKTIKNTRNDKLEIVEKNDDSWLQDSLSKIGFKHFSGFKDEFDMDVNMTVYSKNLEYLTTENVEASYNQTTRRNLRKAQKSGVLIREIKEKEFSQFVEILASSNQKNGVSTRNEGYYHDLKKCFGSRAQFIGTEFEEKLISAGVFVFSKDEVVYFEGGSLQEFRKIPASTFVQDFMIKRAIESGAKEYNFYGVSGDANSSLLRFKSGFRGRVFEYSGEFRKRYLAKIIVSKIFRK